MAQAGPVVMMGGRWLPGGGSHMFDGDRRHFPIDAEARPPVPPAAMDGKSGGRGCDIISAAAGGGVPDQAVDLAEGREFPRRNRAGYSKAIASGSTDDVAPTVAGLRGRADGEVLRISHASRQHREDEQQQQQQQQQRNQSDQQRQMPEEEGEAAAQHRKPADRTGGRSGGGSGSGSGSGGRWSTRVCNEAGCSTVPSYGTPGTKRKFCKQHARPGMINVASKKCGREGCGKVATYGLPGGKRERCAVHADAYMIDIFNRKCVVPQCHLRATFGDERGKRERCARHTEDGMVNFNRRRCAVRGCSEAALHNGGRRKMKQMYCANHATTGEKICSHPGCQLDAQLVLKAENGAPQNLCSKHAVGFRDAEAPGGGGGRGRGGGGDGESDAAVKTRALAMDRGALRRQSGGGQRDDKDDARCGSGSGYEDGSRPGTPEVERSAEERDSERVSGRYYSGKREPSEGVGAAGAGAAAEAAVMKVEEDHDIIISGSRNDVTRKRSASEITTTAAAAAAAAAVDADTSIARRTRARTSATSTSTSTTAGNYYSKKKGDGLPLSWSSRSAAANTEHHFSTRSFGALARARPGVGQRLLLQTDLGWTRWNWQSALDSAQSLLQLCSKSKKHPPRPERKEKRGRETAGERARVYGSPILCAHPKGATQKHAVLKSDVFW